MILYQDVSTSQILEPSQRGLISSSTKLAGKIGQFEICTLCPYVLNLKFSLIRNSSSRDLYTMNLVLPYYSTSFLFCPLLLVMVKLWSFTTGLRIGHCEIWSTLIWGYFRHSISSSCRTSTKKIWAALFWQTFRAESE